MEIAAAAQRKVWLCGPLWIRDRSDVFQNTMFERSLCAVKLKKQNKTKSSLDSCQSGFPLHTLDWVAAAAAVPQSDVAMYCFPTMCFFSCSRPSPGRSRWSQVLKGVGDPLHCKLRCGKESDLGTCRWGKRRCGSCSRRPPPPQIGPRMVLTYSFPLVTVQNISLLLLKRFKNCSSDCFILKVFFIVFNWGILLVEKMLHRRTQRTFSRSRRV